MSNFKIKKDKKIKLKHNNVKNNTTLDKKHQENSKKFKSNEIKSNDLNEKLLNLRNKLDDINREPIVSANKLTEKKI